MAPRQSASLLWVPHMSLPHMSLPHRSLPHTGMQQVPCTLPSFIIKSRLPHFSQVICTYTSNAAGRGPLLADLQCVSSIIRCFTVWSTDHFFSKFSKISYTIYVYSYNMLYAIALISHSCTQPSHTTMHSLNWRCRNLFSLVLSCIFFLNVFQDCLYSLLARKYSPRWGWVALLMHTVSLSQL